MSKVNRLAKGHILLVLCKLQPKFENATLTSGFDKSICKLKESIERPNAVLNLLVNRD